MRNFSFQNDFPKRLVHLQAPEGKEDLMNKLEKAGLSAEEQLEVAKGLLRTRHEEATGSVDRVTNPKQKARLTKRVGQVMMAPFRLGVKTGSAMLGVTRAAKRGAAKAKMKLNEPITSPDEKGGVVSDLVGRTALGRKWRKANRERARKGRAAMDEARVGYTWKDAIREKVTKRGKHETNKEFEERMEAEQQAKADKKKKKNNS